MRGCFQKQSCELSLFLSKDNILEKSPSPLKDGVDEVWFEFLGDPKIRRDRRDKRSVKRCARCPCVSFQKIKNPAHHKKMEPNKMMMMMDPQSTMKEETLAILIDNESGKKRALDEGSEM